MGCGSDLSGSGSSTLATSEPDASSSVPGVIANSVVLPTPTVPVDKTAHPYTVKSGDTLYGIASRVCSELVDLIAVNGWTDGASHAIFPADVILVPSEPCQGSVPANSVGVTTSSEQGWQSVEPGAYDWTLWGDPSDYGAIYATEQCTELQDAGNDLKGTTSALADPAPAQRFLAAVAAMPTAPTPEVQEAIDATVAVYTQYAPVWHQVFRDLEGGLALADNPAWRAAIDVFSAGEVQRDMMWEYVAAACPSVGNSQR